MYNYNIDVDILVNGKPVRQYAHNSRVFIESKHWTEYTIRIKNNHWLRRLVIVSVDGINVLDGQAGGGSKNGYVINGYSSLEVKGFRTSNEVVHPFQFNRKDRSYAANSDATGGDTTNCGVIGVEVYAEYEKPVMYNLTAVPNWTITTWGSTGRGSTYVPTYTCNSLGAGSHEGLMLGATSCNFMNSSLPVADCAPIERKRGFDMGTEFSEREVEDRVHEVEFEIGAKLTSFSIYYASREALIDMGVPVIRTTQISFPEPFPTKFCKPPRR